MRVCGGPCETPCPAPSSLGNETLMMLMTNERRAPDPMYTVRRSAVVAKPAGPNDA